MDTTTIEFQVNNITHIEQKKQYTGSPGSGIDQKSYQPITEYTTPTPCEGVDSETHNLLNTYIKNQTNLVNERDQKINFRRTGLREENQAEIFNFLTLVHYPAKTKKDNDIKFEKYKEKYQFIFKDEDKSSFSNGGSSPEASKVMFLGCRKYQYV